MSTNAEHFGHFGCNAFDDRVMRQRLPLDIYESIRRIRDDGCEWDPKVADAVADAMKTWAIELGATHYIHWFSPMTGIGSGKHDSFIDGTNAGSPIIKFNGKMLSKGESDASSFPSGGLRATFEARGYTTWDPTSPAFVLGTTLYIPTAFCAYTGEALDQKTPVLRSNQALNKQCLRMLRALGDTETVSVQATVGAEQEYFLVDKALFDRRLDLKVAGHTLLGAKPPKGQEMEDHYYGSINERVRAFMRELDDELWALGIPAKTEHNEVAPGQYELASVYATANIACDHNQIMMELMRKVALRHGMACLLHEKPFAGINGSGKHNNWSLVTSNGKNLLDPTDEPAENLPFLVSLCAVLTAVDDYADLLRLSATCPGNEFRLGGGEAPPAIISIFLGDPLEQLIAGIAEGHAPGKSERSHLLTGVKSLPLLMLDDNDRNRTSPFAFTGNKFEFRMVGSSQNIGLANAVLGAAVADTMRRFAQMLEEAENKSACVYGIVKETYEKHKRIIFNGNNYSFEWANEAKRRGLPNLATMVDAAEAFVEDKNIQMFERTHVFTASECRSRHEIMLESYSKTIHIDASVMLEMVERSILPAAMKTLGENAQTAQTLQAIHINCETALSTVQKLSTLIDRVADLSAQLSKALANIPHNGDARETALAFRSLASHEMSRLRCAADQLEEAMPEQAWPIPGYSELLFDL